MLIVRPNQDDREASLRKYFARIKKPPKTLGILLIGIGAVIFLSILRLPASSEDMTGESSNSNKLIMILFGLGPMAAGAIYIARLEAAYRSQVQAAQPSPPDSQVQQWLEEGFRKAIGHSQYMLSLGEAESSFRDPLVIITPVLQAGETDWSLWKQGEDDGVLRFGYYRMIVVHLTDRHLGAYVCEYNFVRNVVLNERTTEYHYHDVVSVTTREESYPYDHLKTGDKLTTKQEFSLSVASGESISVAVESAVIRQITGAEGIPDSGAERAVATIRAMLRDKKGSSYSLAAA
jgi:hypothetical protein